MNNNDSLWASLSVMSALLCTAVGAALAKTLFPLVGVEAVTALRVGFSAVLLACVTRPWRARFDRGTVCNLVGYGAALGLMNILIYQAFSRIPLGIAIAIEVMGPLGIALAYSRRPLDMLWVGGAALGLFLLLPVRTGVSDIDPYGLLFALGAAACWASYIVFGQRVSSLGTGKAVALGMLVASLVAVPLGVSRASGSILEGPVLVSGFVVAILSSAVPYLLEMFAIRRLPQKVMGTLLSCAPALGAFVGALLLREKLTYLQWFSVLLIVCASAGSAVCGREKSRSAAWKLRQKDECPLRSYARGNGDQDDRTEAAGS